MLKIYMGLCMIACMLHGSAQNINAAEYFIDSDPGPGNGIGITSGTGANLSFNATIPTVSLSNGFHFVAIRTRGNDGKWGMYEKAGFYISNATSNAGNITAAEYFIDTDPGPGNGTPIISGSGTSVNFTANIPTASLSTGFHFIGIRTRDLTGKWGLYEKAGFYISNSAANAGNITAAEYFVDTDPGPGNGTALAPGTGTTVNFAANIPTTALSNGFHFLAIRTRDASGKWGLYEKAGFYISSSTTNAGNIVAAEYFIDTDPGPGNGTPIASGTGTNINFAVNIPTTSLSNGFHFAAIRTRDASGKWGFYEKAGFYISTQTINSPGMTEAEYFIDADPGPGNATPFTIPGGQNFAQNFVLPIPVGLSPGQHHIAIRVKNGWGLYEFATFTVGGTVPLEFLSFDGVKEDKKVKLAWTTGNEINTSHFNIERSSNAVQFSKIGETPSANSPGTHQYHFYDLNPQQGINYYRLQQVDIDGKATYSQIVRILFSSVGNPVKLYPNPAADFVNIDFSTTHKNILVNVYDAKGRLVLFERMDNNGPLRMDVSKLPSGRYQLQLSDGERKVGAGFIKQ